jgi:hypothetical protein
VHVLPWHVKAASPPFNGEPFARQVVGIFRAPTSHAADWFTVTVNSFTLERMSGPKIQASTWLVGIGCPVGGPGCTPCQGPTRQPRRRGLGAVDATRRYEGLQVEPLSHLR